MMDPTGEQDRAISRLLSGRDSLSRPEHESVLKTVLEATALEAAPTRVRRRWLWPGVAAGLAAALAAGLALWIAPAEDLVPSEPSRFTARGNSQGPQLTLRCEPACQPGGQVLLEVAETAPYDYVAMLSFREDGAAIWYAPGQANGTSVRLPEGGAGLLSFRIELDAVHPAGTYEVVALFSETPLNRNALREAYEARPEGVAIVERTVLVEEAS